MTAMAFLLSWFFFVLGDLANRILLLNHESEKWSDFWYVIYNDHMCASVWWQDVADGRGSVWPWSEPNPKINK